MQRLQSLNPRLRGHWRQVIVETSRVAAGACLLGAGQVFKEVLILPAHVFSVWRRKSTSCFAFLSFGLHGRKLLCVIAYPVSSASLSLLLFSRRTWPGAFRTNQSSGLSAERLGVRDKARILLILRSMRLMC